MSPYTRKFHCIGYVNLDITIRSNLIIRFLYIDSCKILGEK